jgi:hypothetical protein
LLSPGTRIKTGKLLQMCKQVVTRLLSSRYQDVFALLVPSCCDKSETSCYHLVTRLMTVTDLLQVAPARLIHAVRNKLLRACCHQLVNNLLRADDIRLVGETCCESVGLINFVTRWQQLVSDLSTTGNKQCEHILLTNWEIFTRVKGRWELLRSESLHESFLDSHAPVKWEQELMRVDESWEARVCIRVFSTLMPWSNENKSCMRVEKREFASGFSQLSCPCQTRTRVCMRVDESWEARVCMRVFSTLMPRSNKNKSLHESWLDISQALKYLLQGRLTKCPMTFSSVCLGNKSEWHKLISAQCIHSERQMLWRY